MAKAVRFNKPIFWIPYAVAVISMESSRNNQTSETPYPPAMNRRAFMHRLAALGALLGGGWLFKSLLSPSLSSEDRQAIWRAWIDHLIPADDTPGALDLGIDAAILEKPELVKLIEQGTLWLHETSSKSYGKPFPDLTETEAERVILAASEQPTGSWPRDFFFHTRQAAMQLYYADPRNRVNTVWEHPPQPAGHMDYQQPCRHV